MTAPFIPLLASSKPAPTTFRPNAGVETSVLPQPAFSPIGLSTSTKNSQQPCLPCSVIGNSAPAVSLQRDGDRITQIQIRCACGESIVLDCNYDAEA